MFQTTNQYNPSSSHVHFKAWETSNLYIRFGRVSEIGTHQIHQLANSMEQIETYMKLHEITLWNMLLWLNNYYIIVELVGGWATPLKNMFLRQLGWLFPIYGNIIQSCSSHHQAESTFEWFVIESEHGVYNYYNNNCWMLVYITNQFMLFMTHLWQKKTKVHGGCPPATSPASSPAKVPAALVACRWASSKYLRDRCDEWRSSAEANIWGLASGND